jgi:hypothetical protein
MKQRKIEFFNSILITETCRLNVSQLCYIYK